MNSYGAWSHLGDLLNVEKSPFVQNRAEGFIFPKMILIKMF